MLALGLPRLLIAAAALAVAAALALGVEFAGACSCRMLDPRDRLAEGDPAMVGQVVAKSRLAQSRYGPGYRYTVRVERAFNARTGDEIEISAGESEGACGFEWEIGERVGAFLEREADGWTTSLCSLVDPADLERALLPYPQASGRGTPVLLAGGPFTRGRVIALDSRGRILGYGPGRGAVSQISVCPGSRRAAELVYDGSHARLAVRSLRSLRVLRSVALPDGTGELDCIDRSAKTVLAGAVDYPTKRSLGRVRVFRVRGRRVSGLATRAGDTVALGRGVAYVAGQNGVFAVDLDTGLGRRLAGGRAGYLAPSPDGRRLAMSDALVGLRVVDLRTGRLRSLGRGSDGRPVWLSPDRLLVRGVGRPRLYDGRLRWLRRLPGFRAAGEALVGDRLFGTRDYRLVALDLGSGRRWTVAMLPEPDVFTLVPVRNAPALRLERPAFATTRGCESR